MSSRKLLLAAITALALAAGGAFAIAATEDTGPTPPAKPLNQAVRDALRAPKIQGVTARVEFTNNLLDAGAVPSGTRGPLIDGAQGRVWVARDGRFRLELQSDGGGDAQITYDGRTAALYDPEGNTVYRFRVPAHKKDGKARNRHRGNGVPTIAAIQRVINRVARYVDIAGPTPGNTAGQPSYTVRVSPKRDGGLVGAAELAWDAVRGVPLRAAIYARGSSDPVFELAATNIAYGPISASDLRATAPPDAEVVNVRKPNGRRGERPVEGLARVQRQLSFPLAAPSKLAGLPRRSVTLIEKSRRQKGALVVYGRGLGAIVVAQFPAKAEKPDPEDGDRDRDEFPTVSIDGVDGQEIATALGTVILFERNGVKYIVGGSVEPAAAEAAARGLD